jgi:hypothetical protein
MSGRLFASEVDSFPFERGFPRTLAGVKRLAQNAHRNDQARVEFFAFGGRTKPVESQLFTQPGQKVVTGRTVLKVKVS